MMNDPVWIGAMAMAIAGLLTFAALTWGKQVAQYGRYGDARTRISIPARTAWVIQESPVLLAVAAAVVVHGSIPLGNAVLLGMLAFHYALRTFVYPPLIRGGKPSPLNVVVMAFGFCALNGTLQSAALVWGPARDATWLTDPRFVLGAALFAAGMTINWHADHLLRNLRRPGETGYKIPRGGMFRWVSGANYFGEILEWTGWAVACWNPAAAAFALFTFCNLAPRAATHHAWYRERFADYPANRRAVLPGVW